MNLGSQGRYLLEPGYVFFSRRAITVLSVVGSCVTVCLWDRKLRYGGMNHFLFPGTGDRDNATPRYGNVAIAALLKTMEEAGCKKKNLIAHILGGAHKEKTPKKAQVGLDNVKTARRMLSRRGIHVASEDVGGTMGRKIIFDTNTGHIAVLKVHKIRETDWLEA